MDNKALLDVIFLELHDCNRKTLNDPETIKKALLKSAEVMGAEIMAHSFSKFEPHGVSGTVTIAESHLAIHTWPEYSYAAVTFETCGRNMKHEEACGHLIAALKCKNPEIIRHKRGLIKNPSNNENWHKAGAHT